MSEEPFMSDDASPSNAGDSPTPADPPPPEEEEKAQDESDTTPSSSADIQLTARQQRVLHYLARRRMRNARIVERQPRDERLKDNKQPVALRPSPPDITSSTESPTDATIIDTTEENEPMASLISDADTVKVNEPPTLPLASDTDAVELDEPPMSPLVSETDIVEEKTQPLLEEEPVPAPNGPIVIEQSPIREVSIILTQPLEIHPVVEAASHPTVAPAAPAHGVGIKGRKRRAAPVGEALAANKGIVPALGKAVSVPSSKPSLLEETEKRRKRRKMLRHISRKHMRKARANEGRSRRRMWISITSTILTLLVIFLSLGTAGSVIAYQFYSRTQSKYEHQILTLRDLLPLDNLKMYDSKGALIMQMTDQGIHTTVKLEQVAPILLDATVATEDKNFWTNQGIDILGILRAAYQDLRNGQVVEGGSTITQQLVKNLVVGNQASVTRKLEELILAPQVNSNYSKHDILEMYLNSIYYGHQAYGIDAAATIYYGLVDKPNQLASMQLDLAQSAMLVGIPSNPAAFDPLLHPKAAFNRFQAVLEGMVGQRYITKVQELDAIKEEQSPNFFKTAPSLTNRAPHFANFVLSQLEQLFHLSPGQLSRSGMIVNTTLDVNLQDKIQKIAQQHIAELKAAHNLSNAAEVLIDFHTGAILSLLGSIDYNDNSIDGQFDVATQGYRQPGSSFKPYVYVTAFEQGGTPAQAIADVPTTINDPGGDPPSYSPSNYDLHFHGHMDLRCALQNSLNVPAVRVLRHVGINAAMQMAYNMGITTYTGTPGYSLVLGGLGIRLIDHVSAMGTFANGGVHVPYYAINRVTSGVTNKVLYQHQINPGTRVISPQLAYMMTNVLSDNTSRLPEFFDCNVLQLYSNSQYDCYTGNRGVIRPAAAKTGTTQNFRDNWTVGYTTDFVMGVWAGNDNNSPMIDVTGVQGAAPIWHDSMLLAEQGHPIRNFTDPGGLTTATVTYPDGVKSTDLFLPGTVPTFNPTPTPEPSPTATDTTVTPTPSPGPNPSPTPGPGGGGPPAISQPYCPNDFSFAFQPPSDTTPPNGWW